MKIVFLNPPRLDRKLVGGFSIRFPLYRFNRGVDITHSTIVPPTELAVLAASVEANGSDVDIIDANALNLSFKQTCQRIRDAGPDYLVVRAGYSTFSKDIRFHHYAEDNGIPAILWENTLNPYYTKRIIEDFGLKRMMGNGPERAILRFLDGEEGALTGGRIADINKLPLPLMDKLPMDHYTKRGRGWWYTFSQRGCVWNKCGFCLEYDSPLQMRSMDHLQNEMEKIKEYGLDGVFFWGPELNVTEERMLKIAEIMKNNQLQWECWFRADVVNKNLLDKMKKSGCTKLSIGVESGDQGILDALNKGLTLEQIRKTFKLARMAGIDTQAFHVVGTPYDTVEGLKRTIKLLREIKPSMTAPIYFIPFPNTPLTKIAEDKGLLIRDFYEASINGDCLDGCVFCCPPGMTVSQVEHWMGVFRREEAKTALKTYITRPREWNPAARDAISRIAYKYSIDDGRNDS